MSRSSSLVMVPVVSECRVYLPKGEVGVHLKDELDDIHNYALYERHARLVNYHMLICGGLCHTGLIVECRVP